jgi:hypothetical protein
MSKSTLLAVVILLAPLARDASATEPRADYNFNPDWKLFVGDAKGAQAATFDDSAWKPVTLPHAWNEDSAFKVSIEQLPTGIAWSRKHFTLPADVAGKRVVIEFQGIRHAGEFFVNGKSIGMSEYGVMAFGFDVTDALRPAGEANVIAARIDNSWDYREKSTNSPFQWNDRNFYANYGGINKNVVLHVLPPLHQTLPLYSNLGTTGVYVYASDIDVSARTATVTVEAQVKNEDAAAKTFGYHLSVADMEGNVIKSFDGEQHTIKPGEMTTVVASAKLANVNFWSWGYGYLYTVTTTLTIDGKEADVVHTRTGFRKTEFAHGALKLNGRTLLVHGYAQRTTYEWPALVTDVPPWVSDFSNALQVESGGNVVRWMHVTPSKQDVESCDRVGLIEAMPAGDSEGDPSGRRWEQRVEVMRDAIIYNRNNPSIIFYESGNKGIREEHMKQMLELRNKYDPHGGRAIGSREMLMKGTVAEYGGEMLYINKSAGKPLWAMEYSRDEALRKYADELTPPYHKDGDGPPHKGEPALEYNRNQDSFALEAVRRWYDYWRERPGTGERASGGGVNIIFSDSNTHHRGAENFRRSGEVDAMRLPKDAFFAHQVMWDGWVNVQHPRVHIIGHWNYKLGTKKDVYVVSSADRVELLLNGKSLGIGEQSSRFLYTFKNVAWGAGTLQARGFAPGGAQVCETQIETAGDPVAIKLTPHTRPGGMRADGSDIALLDVEVVDAQGRRVPTAFNSVSFDFSGPAEWRGGIAQGPDNFILARTLPVELGVNRVTIRSTAKAGSITVTAKADGLKPATLQLTTNPVTVTGGVSAEMPDCGLTSPLQRGPTPTGDSVIVTRTPIHVAKVTAGSNADKAALAIDDDETTSWSASGGGSSGWIRFEFDRRARASEVTMKLAGWRTKSYPVRVLVDQKVVFTGRTPRSLGYVTLTFPPTEGKTLTIESSGRSAEQDAYGGIVEVTGQKDTATTRSASGKSAALQIVEAEIYEPLNSSSVSGR